MSKTLRWPRLAWGSEWFLVTKSSTWCTLANWVTKAAEPAAGVFGTKTTTPMPPQNFATSLCMPWHQYMVCAVSDYIGLLLFLIWCLAVNWMESAISMISLHWKTAVNKVQSWSLILNTESWRRKLATRVKMYDCINSFQSSGCGTCTIIRTRM